MSILGRTRDHIAILRPCESRYHCDSFDYEDHPDDPGGACDFVNEGCAPLWETSRDILGCSCGWSDPECYEYRQTLGNWRKLNVFHNHR